MAYSISPPPTCVKPTILNAKRDKFNANKYSVELEWPVGGGGMYDSSKHGRAVGEREGRTFPPPPIEGCVRTILGSNLTRTQTRTRTLAYP